MTVTCTELKKIIEFEYFHQNQQHILIVPHPSFYARSPTFHIPVGECSPKENMSALTVKSVWRRRPYPNQGQQSNGEAHGERVRPQCDLRRVNEKSGKKILAA